MSEYSASRGVVGQANNLANNIALANNGFTAVIKTMGAKKATIWINNGDNATQATVNLILQDATGANWTTLVQFQVPHNTAKAFFSEGSFDLSGVTAIALQNASGAGLNNFTAGVSWN